MRVYSYKITRDYGFAPNPFHGMCSLATCKPQIRRAAQVGDLVIGCGSNANERNGQLICAMRVTEKITFQQYWDNQRFSIKRPAFNSSLAHAYGDNIYHRDAAGIWIQERSHHSFGDGSLNDENLTRDTTTSDAVLLSTDFAYYGRNSIPIPGELRSFLGDDLYPNTRDYRSNFDERFVAAINKWFERLNKGMHGYPIDWPAQI
ncbi:TPA: hypothetical protein ACKQCJ_000716 [Stenotrophomonas maltophilia]